MQLICAHGWLMSPKMWDGIGNAVGIAQPGHAGTAPPPANFSMEAWADWLVAEADRRGIEKAIYAGHSVGGYVVQHVWHRHPERVAGLILIGTTDEPFSEPIKKAFGDLSNAVMLGWGGPISKVCTDLLIGKRFTEANPDWVKSWIEEVATYDLGAIGDLSKAIIHRPDFTSITPRINVPTLVLHGTEDQAMPFEKGKELAGRIPDAKFVAVEGSGHCPPIETPREAAAAISDFVKSAVRATA